MKIILSALLSLQGQNVKNVSIPHKFNSFLTCSAIKSGTVHVSMLIMENAQCPPRWTLGLVGASHKLVITLVITHVIHNTSQ
jgi:hypothetical protein